jgi:hypothetical protein
MLSRLDEIIYPNRCEVLEIVPSQRYIYPIYKNGSSSITEYAQQQGYKTLLNQQISKLTTIDVVLRNPFDRYISGIKTFVYTTKANNTELDAPTILWFAENYLFLNRHYAPQLSWLINLNRFTKAKLKFYGMGQLSQFTPLNVKPFEDVPLVDDIVIERLRGNIHNEMYQRLDTLLLELIGQEVTFQEVLEYLESKDKIAFQKLKCIALD